jgi:hypothetical protein
MLQFVASLMTTLEMSFTLVIYLNTGHSFVEFAKDVAEDKTFFEQKAYLIDGKPTGTCIIKIFTNVIYTRACLASLFLTS